MSDFGEGGNTADSLEMAHAPLGQSYPPHYPEGRDALGAALTIQEVAALLGCSVWTVRHTYLPQGLPYFRPNRLGKLVFFRNQVTQWILHQQKKGGR